MFETKQTRRIWVDHSKHGLTRKEKLQIRLRDRRKYPKSYRCVLCHGFGDAEETVTELHHVKGVTRQYIPQNIIELCHNCHDAIHEAIL